MLGEINPLSICLCSCRIESDFSSKKMYKVPKRSAIVWRSFNICFFLCFVPLCLFAGCKDRKTDNLLSDSNRKPLRFSSQPIGEQRIFQHVNAPLPQKEEAIIDFKTHLKRLADFAESIRTNSGNDVAPNIFADQFETTFLERNKLQSAYLGERLRIARWRLSESTPTLYDTIAVKQLFETLLKEWSDAEDFRIDFKIHTVLDRPNYYDAEVLVDIYGRVKSDGNGSEVGRSAVGLWQIIWQKAREGITPQIKKINMLGHEEILYLAGGKLFEDCTRSALRNDEELINNLSYGLDDWVQRIPGIDPKGNNGLAIGDVNSDGLDDVYVCQPHGLPNLLLTQNPDGTFDDVAADAGVDVYDNSTSALLVDINNNRLQDLIVATDNRLVLYSNGGNGTFQKEHSLRIGVGTESLSAIDYDLDGDLDLFLAKYRPVSRFDDLFAQPNARMSAINGGRNVLLRNDESWTFKDVTLETGLSYSNQNYTNAAIWNDFDADGDFDLYLANEYFQDILFQNDNGWFSEVDKGLFSTHTGNSSTVSSGDFNRDGKPDFFVGVNASFTNKRITRDYIEAGGKQLRDARGYGGQNRLFFRGSKTNLEQWPFRAPLFSSESTFSSVVADFNNDSWEDIATTNGLLSRSKAERAQFIYYRNLFDPKKDLVVSNKASFQLTHEISDLCRQGDSFDGFERNRLFMGLGPLRFANFSNTSGMDFLDDSRGIGTTDWDGDGDVDLIVTNRTEPRVRFLRNVYSSNNQFLKLRLSGTASNRDAIGSRIEVFLRGASTPLVKSLVAGSGRISQSSKEMHFGLGAGTSIDRVDVYWPNTGKQSFSEIQAGRTYNLTEGDDQPAELANDRYRIALDSNLINLKDGLPDVKRISFFPTTRLPILQYRGEGNSAKQKWYQIEPADQQPLFLILCPYSYDATSLMRDWNLRESNFSRIKADVLLAFTGVNTDTNFELKRAVSQVQEIGFKFRWGVLSESSNTKLQMLFGQWFFNMNLPAEPIGFLIDGSGNIHYGYEGEMLTWERVGADLQNIADRNFVLNKIPERDDETWIVDRRTPRFDRLHRRFSESGLVRDAEVYEELLSQQRSDDYINRSIDLASSGKTLAALSAAEKSIELNSDSLEAQINLADVQRQFAMTADQQARKRMLSTAGELLDKAIETEPNNEEAILARAEIFRLQRDIENAVGLLKRYLKINPESWQVHAVIGRLFFHKRQDFEATKYLITAIENRPTLPFVAADLGYLYLLNNQYADAKEYLELAIRLQPSDANLRRYLAEAEFWNGNFDKAGELFEATVQGQPRRSHPKQMLAWLKGSSPFAKFRDGKKGIELIESLVEVRGNQSPSILETMAVCLADVGKFDEALTMQRQALKAIEDGSSLEKYNDEQKKALRDRMELYKRKREYRLANVNEVPMKLLGEN